MRFGVLAPAVGRVAEQHRRGCRVGPGSTVSHIGPEPPGLGLAAPGLEHGHRGVVAVQVGARHDVARERLDQGIEERGGATDAVSERRALERHPLAGLDLRLPIQRQMTGILGDQDVGEQAWTGQSACDRPAWRRHLQRLPGRPQRRAFGRTCRITLKLAGTYSRISATSLSILFIVAP